MADRDFHPKVKAFDSPWFAVPTFFTEDLMRLGRGIPNSFWKLTFVVWRDVLKPKKNPSNGEFFYEYIAKTTFDQLDQDHNINPKAAQEWQAAYWVSGLFSVQKGKYKRKGEPGTPTIWHYNVNATKADWLAFIVALREIAGPLRDGKIKRRGTSDDGSAMHFFQLALAIEVDKQRAIANGTMGPALPPVNEKKIKILRNGMFAQPEPVER